MKKRQKEMPSEIPAEKVSVNNWTDWFKLCGSMVQDLQENEGYMQKFYFDLQ